MKINRDGGFHRAFTAAGSGRETAAVAMAVIHRQKTKNRDGGKSENQNKNR